MSKGVDNYQVLVNELKLSQAEHGDINNVANFGEGFCLPGSLLELFLPMPNK